MQLCDAHRWSCQPRLWRPYLIYSCKETFDILWPMALSLWPQEINGLLQEINTLKRLKHKRTQRRAFESALLFSTPTVTWNVCVCVCAFVGVVHLWSACMSMYVPRCYARGLMLFPSIYRAVVYMHAYIIYIYIYICEACMYAGRLCLAVELPVTYSLCSRVLHACLLDELLLLKRL